MTRLRCTARKRVAGPSARFRFQMPTQFLDPKQTILTRLKMAMENMKTLVLYDVDFYDLYQISNMLCLVRSSPNLKSLKILVFLDPKQTILTRLKMAMENMKTLVLYDVDFYDLCQISNMLCLVRSSPNLQSLKISAGIK